MKYISDESHVENMRFYLDDLYRRQTDKSMRRYYKKDWCFLNKEVVLIIG